MASLYLIQAFCLLMITADNVNNRNDTAEIPRGGTDWTWPI